MLIYSVCMRYSDLRYLLVENCGPWKIGVDYVKKLAGACQGTLTTAASGLNR
jgi:hypothetical protein